MGACGHVAHATHVYHGIRTQRALTCKQEGWQAEVRRVYLYDARRGLAHSRTVVLGEAIALDTAPTVLGVDSERGERGEGEHSVRPEERARRSALAQDDAVVSMRCAPAAKCETCFGN